MTRTLHETTANQQVICPAGFRAAGIKCGIKASGNDDLALIDCPNGATAAALFTRNSVKAAPVVISQSKLQQSGGRVRALVINSGCANAATGEDGKQRADRVMNELASHLECPPEQVLMNSTGVIGEPLPADLIIAGLHELISACSPHGLVDAAAAIMTTDTVPKMAQQTVSEGDRTCRVVGIAKGSGMIHPNMATMIGVILTDAAVDQGELDAMLREGTDQSFHRISVDGDTSTNDAVFALASGKAGRFSREALAPAMNAVARDLATMIVRDGEGANRLIRVNVTGAATQADALAVARTVAGSMLVRTSVTGGDPNWGRLLMAIGRSGVPCDEARLTLTVNGLPLFAHGKAAGTALSQLTEAYRAEEVIIGIDLGSGEASDTFLTCDLTEQYVQINADYHT